MPENDRNQLIVFVHGWSVMNTDTYGGLPVRLASQAASIGLKVTVEEVFLGQYISFKDEVRVEDIARAFEAAVHKQLARLVRRFGKFTCVTHSTGGPVIRDWADRYYTGKQPECPMSHLVMLAPANFGSSLAQLGKQRVSRIKSWFQGVEPGQGVLDWLELGSVESWELNQRWIKSSKISSQRPGYFSFVMVGQSIDRKIYDSLNPYTGEDGSDGVVRVAAANLNATYIEIEQEPPKFVNDNSGDFAESALKIKKKYLSPKVAMLVVPEKSHSGKEIGIMRSIKPNRNNEETKALIENILACIECQSEAAYAALSNEFSDETDKFQEKDTVEIDDRLFRGDRIFFHDRYSMIVFRVTDEQGHPITDYDLLLTAEEESDHNLLPEGFCRDRQRNRIHPNMLTYYLNHDIIRGCDERIYKGDKYREANPGIKYREAKPGIKRLGLKVVARPDSGFVHYVKCELKSSKKLLETLVKPNQTIYVNIVLRRVVHEGVFKLNKGFKQGKFKRTKPGQPIS